MAMNRLRRAYLTLEPGLERYLTTGHHDDQQGVFVTYMVDGPATRRALWVYCGQHPVHRRDGGCGPSNGHGRAGRTGR